jgi:DHA1 family multidrug resistance protein-like MFS transporter
MFEPFNLRYLIETSAVYISVFLMRFSFAFTVVAIQWLVPVQVDRGIISSAYPAMEMATALIFGMLADKMSRKWIVVSALLASSIITISFTLTKNIAYLTIIHGLQGICAAAIVTSTLALLTDYAKVSRRGREMGVYDFSTIGGYGIGFGFALALVGGNPGRAIAPFYAGAAIAVVGAIVSAVILKDVKAIPKNEKVSIRENFRGIASHKSVFSLMPVWFVLMTMIGVALTYTRELSAALLPRVLQFIGSTSAPAHGALPERIGILELALLIVGSILLGFTQSSFGSLSDRFGRVKIIAIGEVAMLGLTITLVSALLFPIDRLIIILIAVPFAAGILAFTPAALAELADVSPLKGRGSTMGFYSLTVGAGTVFGPLAGGFLISAFGPMRGLAILFGICSLILVFAFISRTFFQRHSK